MRDCLDVRLASPLGRLLVVLVALGTAAISLQGCGVKFTKDDGTVKNKKNDDPLEICPEVKFKGNGFVAESRAGETVKITCPTDYAYDGPDIECSWVDRFCVAYGQQEINPDFCYNQYNLTLPGQGLLAWPADVSPKIMLPPGAPGSGLKTGANITLPSGVNISLPAAGTGPVPQVVGRRLASSLPTVIAPDQLLCKDEAYTELNFEEARVVLSEKPWRLEYRGIAVDDSGDEVDLVVSAAAHHISSSPDRNGKGSAMGRISLNGSGTVPLHFHFVSSSGGLPVTLRKVFFTLFDIVDEHNRQNDLQITVGRISEYFVSKKTSVVIKELVGGSQYVFGGLDIAKGSADEHLHQTDAQPPQASVKQMWLDSLNRTVVLMFRNISQFTLFVNATPGPRGRDFEFTGWSEVAKMGEKVMCLQPFEAKFSQMSSFLHTGSGSSIWPLSSAALWGLSMVVLAGSAASLTQRFRVRHAAESSYMAHPTEEAAVE